MNSAALWLTLVPAVALGAQTGQGTQNPATANQGVRFGVTVSKDTVTVGEPFAVRVRVRAPAAARIRFPENPDTAGQVQARDPRVIQTTDSVQWLDQIATYHVAAWDIGRQPILFDDAVVTGVGPSTAGDRPVPLGNITVFVRSILPADSALRVPKPARPLWEPSLFPWWIVALLAALAALAYWWWRRRQRRPAVAPVVVDPYARAQREFDRIEAMGLVDAGEFTRYVTLIVEVLRDYFASRHPEALLALTSHELVAALRRRPAVPLERLSGALREVDLAKFGGFVLSADRARMLAHEARAIVAHDRDVSQAPPPTQVAA